MYKPFLPGFAVAISASAHIAPYRGQSAFPPRTPKDSLSRIGISEGKPRPIIRIDSLRPIDNLISAPTLPHRQTSTTEGIATSAPIQSLHQPLPSSQLVEIPSGNTLEVGQLRLKSFASQSHLVDIANVRHESKGLGLEYALTKQISLSTQINLGHSLSPYESIPHHLLNLSVGANIRPSTNSLIGLSATYERLMDYQAWRPEVYGRIHLGDRWQLSAYAGAAFYSPQTFGTNGTSGVQYYMGARVQFALSQQWYLYGTAHTTTHRGWQGGYPAAPFARWSPSVGGGIGFNIKDAGPIELGVTYHYNPISNRMEPTPSINIAGGIMLLVKAIKRLFSDD